MYDLLKNPAKSGRIVRDMPKTQSQNEEFWRKFLLEGEKAFVRQRRFLSWLPAHPRCKFCGTPFAGIGANLVKLFLGKTRSRLNPLYCNSCDLAAQNHPGGIEVELTSVFADVRGSTTLAENMSPGEFSTLMNRFYAVATDAFVHKDGLIDKFVGDEVIGLFLPGFAGAEHAKRALEAAQELLKQTGHGDNNQAWLPIGIGVHTGVAFCGTVGKASVLHITALGDAMNVTARLASKAKAGEILLTEAAVKASDVDQTLLEKRRLKLKGKSKQMLVYVLHA